MGDVAEDAKFFLPDTPCTILSIPIIKRLTANINVRINIPNNGFIKTINDIPIDNIPTATRNILDHFEVCLSKTPWTILATPINKSPIASKVTNSPIVNIGKAITIIANAIAKPPNTILLILVDDFLIYGKKPIDTLSIPTTNNETERRNTRISIPNPGFIITAIERAIAMIPTTICKILMPLATPFSDSVFIQNKISFQRILKYIYLFNIKIIFFILEIKRTENNRQNYCFISNSLAILIFEILLIKYIIYILEYIDLFSIEKIDNNILSYNSLTVFTMKKMSITLL